MATSSLVALSLPRGRFDQRHLRGCTAVEIAQASMDHWLD